MFRYTIVIVAIISAIASSHAAYAAGTLSGNKRIKSDRLGYALQYRVYTPDGIDTLESVPTIYMTDGQWYIKSGKMVKELNRQIAKGAIKPVIAVFVDNRDPDNLRKNRRNQQFFCNPDYVKFFTNELVPTITDNYPASQARNDRVILGLSFGGLNAACFGLMAHPTFGGIAMQSPATHPIPKLFEVYASEETRPVKIFFSTGTQNDNVAASR